MAVTVTIDASYIYVNSSAETDDMDDVYDAVQASATPTAMSRSGSPGAYTYSIDGNRAFWIRNTGTYVTLQTGCTLFFNVTGNKAPIFRVETTANFKAEAGTTIDFNSTTGRYGRVYLYGACILEGTSGSHVTLDNVFEIYMYKYYNGYYKQWDYVDVNSSIYSASANTFVFQWDGFGLWERGNDWWRNVVIDGDPGSTGTKYGRWNIQAEGMHNFEISDCTFKNMQYPVLAYSMGAKFTRCTFQDNYYQIVCRGGWTTLHSINNRIPSFSPELNGQPFTCVFEECVFENNLTSGTSRGFYGGYKGSMKFKNCTYQNSYYGFQNTYAAINYFVGTQTFSGNTDDLALFGYTVINHAYELDLTVQDSGGSPVEGAVVQLRQKEGNEVYTFTTNSSGKIEDIYGDTPILTYQQEGPETTFDVWSNGSGNQVHVIEVYKAGVGFYTAEVAMDQDRAMTVQLTTCEDYGTTIYDSVLYDTVVN